MRTQIFRTPPTLVGPYDAVVLKDMDGVGEFTLFVENVDVKASLRTRFGSKNANVRFVALEDGTAGNAVTVVITAGPSQEYSITLNDHALTIGLLCDASGRPNQTVNEIIDTVNSAIGQNQVVRLVLALGSDGSASMEVPDPAGAPTVVLAETHLAGGFDATDLGGVMVEISPTGAPDFAGPWEVDHAASDSFSAPYGLTGGTTGAHVFYSPVRGLRVTLDAGPYPTMAVVSAVAAKKAL